MPPSASCSRDHQTPNSAVQCAIRIQQRPENNITLWVAHLIAVSPEPVTISIVELVLKANRDPVSLKRKLLSV